MARRSSALALGAVAVLALFATRAFVAPPRSSAAAGPRGRVTLSAKDELDSNQYGGYTSEMGRGQEIVLEEQGRGTGKLSKGRVGGVSYINSNVLSKEEVGEGIRTGLSDLLKPLNSEAGVVAQEEGFDFLRYFVLILAI